MKNFISILALISLMATAYAQDSKSSCKKKGFKFDKKNSACSEKKISKRKSCEKKSGTWNEDSGACVGVVKLKGQEKKALKLVKAAAKGSSLGQKLSEAELVELAKDLANYSKAKKVKLKKIKITFDSTGKKENTTGEELKEVSSKNGTKLYHVDEGVDVTNDPTEKPEVTIETEERDIVIPTNFFPPNYHEYTAEGKEQLISAIIGDDEAWQIFNISIVESSASKLANTAGDYKFSSGDSNTQKGEKLKGLALARSNSTEAMLKGVFPEIKITNAKNAVVSGSADCYGSGDTSGSPAPANVASACKSGNKSVVSNHYNAFQYVKLKVEYMKETTEIVKVLEDNIKEIPNAEGILAQFKHNKKYKSKKKKRISLKYKKKRTKHRYKKPKKHGKKKNWGSVKCPKF